MRKLLILPSWYIHPGDTINGSYIQEQAQLVTDQFDTKVLLVRFTPSPSIRALLKNPIKTALEWIRFIREKKSRKKPTNAEVFCHPPLVEYQDRVIRLTQRQRHQKRIESYLQALDELIASGWKPDLVHAHSVNLGGMVAERIKAVYGIPYVITEHLPFVLTEYPEYMRESIKRAFHSADGVLSVGYDMIRQLGISGIEVEPNILYNLVDESIFNKLCEPYMPGMPLKLVSIGAASHYKDHPTLVRAMRLLTERGVPCTLTLIGLKVRAGLYAQTVECIKSNGLAHIVSVIDQIERPEVCDYLVKHHAFVMSSICETFGISIIEALACGLPVVTTNHGGGSLDMITEDTGVVVPVRHAHALADTLEAIYRGVMRFEPRQIRQSVIAQCGRDAFKQRLIGYYERAMKHTM